MKKKYLLLTFLLSFNLMAQSNSPAYLTTPVARWDIIQERLMIACSIEKYKVKSISPEHKEVTCFKEENIKGLELLRNIRFSGQEVMVGHYILSSQWLEGEDNDGNLKIYNINENLDVNKEHVMNILKHIE